MEINNTKKIDPKIIYDVIIIGAGPAGLTAGVYCMRKGISTALITYDIGGQVAITSNIENYMGFRYIEGYELVNKFQEQVNQFVIGFVEGRTVISIKNGEIKEVHLDNNDNYKAKVLIIATGNSQKKLNVPGENEFIGRGVAYCSTCDAPFYKNKDVFVVGGGNSGIESALDLLKIAKKVTIVQNIEKLTAEEILTERLKDYKTFNILYNIEVKEILGSNKVTGVKIFNKKEDKYYTFTTDGVFIEIGFKPNSEFVKDILDLNENNEIIVDCLCQTNVPGIFAAGDVTNVKHKQIIIATGEGAKAALSAYNYILHKWF